jgi:hypothetical protein
MAWTAERTTINQKIQVGAEATTALGTGVSAGKILQAFDIGFGIEAETAFYAATGHKYDSTQEENTEWASGELTGNLDYNHVIYPLAGAMGSVSVVAHGASATAKDWIFTPPITGSIVPQTYTFEQGDAIRAHKFTYGLFTKFGYKATRKNADITASLIAQPIADAITMTSSPTAVALAPIVAKHLSVYLDPTSGALGSTQLTRVLFVDYVMDSIYTPLWVLNRSTVGWTAHVDAKPKAELKLKVEADANGMALLGYLQSGTKYFLRVQAQGNQIASDGPGAINNIFQHDMCITIDKPSKFEDDQGVFAIEWPCHVMEDATWGKSQMFTVTNLIAAL